MSRHDFSREEFDMRRARVREAMRQAGLDWLVMIHPVSIHWLTGSDAKSYQEFQCLCLSAEPGPLVVLTREGECNEFRDDAWVDEIHGWGGGRVEDPIARFGALAERLGLRGMRVGMEVPAYYLHPHHYVRICELLGSDLVAEATNLVPELKMVKSPAELAYIRRANALADRGMEAFREALAPGRTELAVAGRVYEALLSGGSGLAASPINLVSGERSCYSHGAPTERELRPGDFGSVEFGATYRRYTATLGRQFSLGAPTPRMRELYELVLRASDAMIAEIRDGVPAIVPHEAACRVIGAAGLERGRVHTSGYGLAPGFPPSWSEPIHMLGDTEAVLHAGMVVTIEPPVFLDTEPLGARLIDNVLVTETGADRLARFPRELLVV
ncbi:MAG: aminopeptidase P family protein [Armatimonadetes bacterium]|nr:aminopeptidase P family protein [Armatimonadota bacterium]